MVVDFGRLKRNFSPLLINGMEVKRVNSAEILGVLIQDNMTWSEHVTKIVTKAGKRLYMLRLLKGANADKNTMLMAFTTIIRPVLEYACQVWHFNIPGYLSDDIERVQRRALKIMLPLLSYNDARESMNIPLLKERREMLCETFFSREENLQKLNEFLPEKPLLSYDMRSKCNYNNYYCKTERFRKSFLPQIITKANSL